MNATENKNISLVLLSTLIFLTFSMMHEFDWLIPANPAAVAIASSIPVPDIVEEPGSEDEIEHEEGYTIRSYNDRDFKGISSILVNPHIPSVPLPPPDMV